MLAVSNRGQLFTGCRNRSIRRDPPCNLATRRRREGAFVRVVALTIWEESSRVDGDGRFGALNSSVQRRTLTIAFLDEQVEHSQLVVSGSMNEVNLRRKRDSRDSMFTRRVNVELQRVIGRLPVRRGTPGRIHLYLVPRVFNAALLRSV